MENLEKLYIRDCIKESEYAEKCKRMLTQFKTLSEGEGHIKNLEEFMAENRLNCPYAEKRLKQGVPATTVHGSAGDKQDKSLHVFHAVQSFITTMDQLKLNMKAVDELHPNVSDIMESLNKVDALPPDHESRTKVMKWLQLMAAMKASDELTEEQGRQMSFDLQTAYDKLHKFVEEQSKKK